ncbi:hypothetical protein D3C81_1381620 [compost metagenome]
MPAARALLTFCGAEGNFQAFHQLCSLCICRRIGQRCNARAGGQQHKAQFVLQAIEAFSQFAIGIQRHRGFQRTAETFVGTSLFQHLVHFAADFKQLGPEAIVHAFAFGQTEQAVVPLFSEYVLRAFARQEGPDFIGSE